jgi:hypothetical protein
MRSAADGQPVVVIDRQFEEEDITGSRYGVMAMLGGMGALGEPKLKSPTAGKNKYTPTLGSFEPVVHTETRQLRRAMKRREG